MNGSHSSKHFRFLKIKRRDSKSSQKRKTRHYWAYSNKFNSEKKNDLPVIRDKCAIDYPLKKEW